MRYVADDSRHPTRVLWGYSLIEPISIAGVSIFAPHLTGFAIAFWLAVTALLPVYCHYYISTNVIERRMRCIIHVALANLVASGVLVFLAFGLAFGFDDAAVFAGSVGAVAGFALAFAIYLSVALAVDPLLNSLRAFLGPHHCAQCGYDLTGNVSGRCPECGTATRKPPNQ